MHLVLLNFAILKLVDIHGRPPQKEFLRRKGGGRTYAGEMRGKHWEKRREEKLKLRCKVNKLMGKTLTVLT